MNFFKKNFFHLKKHEKNVTIMNVSLKKVFDLKKHEKNVAILNFFKKIFLI